VAVWRTTNAQDWQRVLLERGSGVMPLAATADNAVFAGVEGAVLRAGGEHAAGWHRAAVPGIVSSLKPSPVFLHDRTLAAATTAGLCVSRDGGTQFHAVGFGDGPVVAVAFSPTYPMDRLVYAVELGGRVWRGRWIT